MSNNRYRKLSEKHFSSNHDRHSRQLFLMEDMVYKVWYFMPLVVVHIYGPVKGALCQQIPGEGGELICKSPVLRDQVFMGLYTRYYKSQLLRKRRPTCDDGLRCVILCLRKLEGTLKKVLVVWEKKKKQQRYSNFLNRHHISSLNFRDGLCM